MQNLIDQMKNGLKIYNRNFMKSIQLNSVKFGFQIR